MKRLALINLVAFLTGCSLMSTEFVDVDGTRYAATVWAAPFSDISGNDARMAYDWDGHGGGAVGVGQGADRIDHTKQGPAIESLISQLATAYLMSQAPGFSAFAPGGTVVSAPVNSEEPYDALDYLRSIPEADARAIWKSYRASLAGEE